MASLAEIEIFEKQLDKKLISLREQMKRTIGEEKKINEEIENLEKKTTRYRELLAAEEEKGNKKDMSKIIEYNSEIGSLQQKRLNLIKKENEKFQEFFREFKQIREMEVEEVVKERLIKKIIDKHYGSK